MLLHTGADEYVLLLADDYLAILNKLIHRQQQLAAQHALQQDPTSSSDGTAGPNQPRSMSAAEAASIATTLQLFRDRVVPSWTDSSIPRSTLLQLLRQPPSQDSTGAAAAPGRPAGQQPTAAAAGGKEPAHERHLLALDLLCRDSRSPDSYQLTVPGAAAFVKSVVSGRQELLQLLGRKK